MDQAISRRKRPTSSDFDSTFATSYPLPITAAVIAAARSRAGSSRRVILASEGVISLRPCNGQATGFFRSVHCNRPRPDGPILSADRSRRQGAFLPCDRSFSRPTPPTSRSHTPRPGPAAPAGPCFARAGGCGASFEHDTAVPHAPDLLVSPGRATLLPV